MLSYVRGEYFALAFRRGITHGWPALLVLPFLVAGAVLAWDRFVRRRRHPEADPTRPAALLLLSTLGLATHPTLDWLNTYGMRWGLPFDGRWTYGDALFIIDPWVWLILGGAVFLSVDPGRRGLAGWSLLAVLTTALVVLGIGGTPAVVWLIGIGLVVGLRLRLGPGRSPARGRAVRRSLGVVAAYVGLMVGADLVARREVLRAAEGAGFSVHDVLVAPLRGTPHRAEVEVVTDRSIVPGSHDWLRAPRVELREADAVALRATDGLADTIADRVVEVARTRPNVRNYLVWSRFPYVRVTPTDGGWDVVHADARYDSRREAGGLRGVRVLIREEEIR